MFGWFRRSDDWGDVPRALGVGVDAHGNLRGYWGGVELFGAHATERESYIDEQGLRQESEHRVTWFYAKFDPPLRLGLSIAADNALSRFVQWVRSDRDIEVGEPGFDKAFRVAARDAMATRSLLNGAVAAELVRARARHTIVTVNDDELCITENGWTTAPATVASAFEVVGRAATEILASRRGLVLPWEMQLRERWARALAPMGLAFDPIRLDARGVVRGLFVTVEVDGGDALATVVKVAAPAPFATGLRIFRQEQGVVARWFRGQDILVGDTAFDDAFVVKGEDESEVRAVLGGLAARRLLQLRAGGAVTIENNTLTVRAERLEIDHVAAMVTACVEAAMAMVAQSPRPAK